MEEELQEASEQWGEHFALLDHSSSGRSIDFL